MGKISPHFSKEEFDCPCGCESPPPSGALLELLEKMREKTGSPVVITSGYRCARHNHAVGGKTKSAHLLAEAADLKALGGKAAFETVKAAIECGARRIGVGDGFIHVDTASTLPSPMLWTY